jgi:hypothetical protein
MSFCVIFKVECPQKDNMTNKKAILDLFKLLGADFDTVDWMAGNTYTLEIPEPLIAIGEAQIFEIENPEA